MLIEEDELKEEEELIREFGREYEDYKKKVGMFFPKT